MRNRMPVDSFRNEAAHAGAVVLDGEGKRTLNLQTPGGKLSVLVLLAEEVERAFGVCLEGRSSGGHGRAVPGVEA